jgi:hypothetical protein
MTPMMQFMLDSNNLSEGELSEMEEMIKSKKNKIGTKAQRNKGTE